MSSKKIVRAAGLAVAFAMSANASVWAAELGVKITSFVAAGSRTRAAELCGKVTGLGGANPTAVVRVVVDEKTSKPAVYNVLVGSDGSFCTTVVSYAGTAVASVWDQSDEISSEQAVRTNHRSASR